MPSEKNVSSVAEIKQRFEDAPSIVLVDYRGLSVKEIQVFRRAMRESGCELKVYKNRLAKIAASELGLIGLEEFLEGPTGFGLGGEDPVAVSKVIVDFAEEHDALEVKAALIDGAVQDAATVKALAALPSREELLAKFAGMLANPVRGFMSMATAPAGALTRALKAVAAQKAAA